MKRLFTLILLFSFAAFATAVAQDVTMPTSGTETITSCSGNFYDSGGPGGEYQNNESGIVVFQPDGADLVALTFTVFDVENNFEDLYIYDGPDIGSPLIGEYTNNVLPNNGELILSTGNALTVQFTSDGSVLDIGWEAAYECINITEPPTPSFSVDNEITCNGDVQFTDETILPNAWEWDFGDGSPISTEQNPSHTYVAEGTYSVTFTACNDFGCNTITEDNIVIFDSQDISCFEFFMPVTGEEVITGCEGVIYDDGGANGQYSNSANATIVIDPGETALIQLTFTQFNIENGFEQLFLYDGPDSNSPLIGQYTGSEAPNGGNPILTTNNTATLVFTSDGVVTLDGFVIEFECILLTEPPVAEFVASPPFSCGGDVQFVDKSGNAPTEWTWDFGDGNGSDEKNPLHTYASSGEYDVTLTTCNANGCDETTVTGIQVLDADHPACQAIVMVQNDNVAVTECFGFFTDSGDLFGNYSDNELSSVTLGNPGVSQVDLQFTEFNVATGQDFVNIYDGPSTGSPLIAQYSGTFVPENGGIISSSGSYLTIELFSNAFTNTAGFVGYWKSNGSTNAPTADFSLSDPNPPFGVPVQFTDLTTEQPSNWEWDFGDGEVSFEQNPAHAFTTAGPTTVNLTAANCVDESIAPSQSLTVQNPPTAWVNPESFYVELESGESTNLPLTISNFGGGDLVYNLDGFGEAFAGIIQVLVYNFNPDGNEEFETSYNNTVTALQDNLFNLNLYETNTTDPDQLFFDLESKQVFIVPAQELVDPAVFADFAPVLEGFINDGGTVLFTGTTNDQVIFNTNLFDGNYVDYLFYPELEFTDPAHPIAQNIGDVFFGQSGSLYYDITNDDKITLVEEDGFDMLSYREIGAEGGKAMLLGFNYQYANEDMIQILVNAVKFATVDPTTQWLFVDPITGTVFPGGTGIVDVLFDATNAPAGTYFAELIIYTNDPDNPIIIVPCTLVVSGAPEITLSDAQIDFGNVIQFTSESANLTIFNTGTDTLFVTGIDIPATNVSVNLDEFWIYPGLQQTIVFTYAPTEIETLDIDVVIFNDDADAIVNLIGNGTGAPQISANPNPVEYTLNVGEFGGTTLNVSNLGLGDLDFTAELFCAGSATGFQIDLTTDDFPFEFSWDLIEDGVGVVASAPTGTYTTAFTDYTEIIEGLNSSATYTWELYDTFGDGGLDAYTATDLASGVEITSGGFPAGEALTVPLGAPSAANTVDFFPDNGFIPFDNPEDVVIDLFFDATELLGGTYECTMTFTSNDPLTPTLEVPVILTVVGIPLLVSSQTVLDFGSVLDGATNSITITISNPGTDNLIVDDFLFDLPQYSADISSFDLAPGESIDVTITFAPDAIGDYDSEVTIDSNIEDVVLTLLGTGQGAPIAAIDPTSIVTQLLSGESTDIDLTLSNTGEGNLEYSITIIGGPEVTIDPLVGIVGFPDDLTITVNLDADGLPANIYSYTIEITTNDPNNPLIVIPVTMNVIAFPQAVFTSNETFLCGDQELVLTDASVNVPTTWEWDFGDGIGTSMDQNPTYVYGATGTYTVTLTACNDLGCDENTLDIEVDYGCEIVNIPVTSNETIGACNGTLHDSGGPDEDYFNSNDGVMTIAPAGALSVTLEFLSFDYEENWDSIHIYDGPDINSPLIGSFGGSTLPNGDGIVSSTGEAITIRETSDFSTNFGGFVANFTCEQPEAPPIANFEAIPTSVCSGLVQFNDLSTTFPTEWTWDFGDGVGTSTEQSPSYQYTSSGTFTVTLEACNVNGCDTHEIDLDLDVLWVVTDVPDSILVDIPHTFNDMTVGANSWLWDAGNAQLAGVPSPSFTYTELGWYTVSLQVSNTNIPNCTVNWTKEMKVVMTIGIDDLEDGASLNISPNPSSDFVNINYDFEGSKDLIVRVFSPIGQEVFMEEILNATEYNKQLNLANEVSGLYLVKISSETGDIVRKVTVQR